MKALFARLKADVLRYGWAMLIVLFACLFIGVANGKQVLVQQLGVLAWKLVLVGVSVFVAFRVRMQLFPYVDLSAAIADKDKQGGQIFLGVCVLTAAIILAVCSGL